MEPLQFKQTGNIVRDLREGLDEVRQRLERQKHAHAIQAITVERKQWVSNMVAKYGKDTCNKTRSFHFLAETPPPDAVELQSDFEGGDGSLFVKTLEKRILEKLRQ